MFRHLNWKTEATLFLGGCVTILFILPVFYSLPTWDKFVTVVAAGYVVYLILRLVWIVTEPGDTAISFKPQAVEAQRRGLCLLCRKNRQGDRVLKVGYRRKTSISGYLGILIGGYMEDGICLSVPVCERCARRHMFLSKLGSLAPLGLDGSFRVLKRKPGYLRGLEHPFERSNIEIAG